MRLDMIIQEEHIQCVEHRKKESDGQNHGVHQHLKDWQAEEPRKNAKQLEDQMENQDKMVLQKSRKNK